MKVLILGAKGMLGTELVKVYNDTQVLAWDRDECDITNADQVRSKILEAKPDLVINCAAYNNVDAAEGEGKELAYLLNRDAPRFIAEVAKELDVPFVQYTSDYVFDGAKSDGYVETDEPNPISEYAKSKAEGEARVLGSGAKVYVIRPSRIFGQMGTGEGVKESFVDLILRMADEGRDEFDMVDEEMASPTYAPDLARRTREIVENHPPGIYHGTNEGACTWFGFAEEIFKRAGRDDVRLNPVPTSFYPRPAARPPCSWLKNTKLPPARTWQAALAEYMQFRQDKKNK